MRNISKTQYSVLYMAGLGNGMGKAPKGPAQAGGGQ